MISRFLQCKDRARNTKTVECSALNVPMKGGYRMAPMTQAFLFFSSILFTAIADDNSCQGCATRSAINTPNDTLPLPFFGSRSSFHVLTCRLPLLWKRKNDHAVSVCPI